MEIAKELFKKLGYRYSKHSNHGNIETIFYDNIDAWDNGTTITFYLDDKSINVATDRTASDNQTTNIDLRLLKAINKQVEELGWGKEEK